MVLTNNRDKKVVTWRIKCPEEEGCGELCQMRDSFTNDVSETTHCAHMEFIACRLNCNKTVINNIKCVLMSNFNLRGRPNSTVTEH